MDSYGQLGMDSTTYEPLARTASATAPARTHPCTWHARPPDYGRRIVTAHYHTTYHTGMAPVAFRRHRGRRAAYDAVFEPDLSVQYAVAEAANACVLSALPPAIPSSRPVVVRHASAASTGIMSSRSRSDQAAAELSRKRAWHREHVKYPFWFGGSASCFAACVTHPLDLGEEQRATAIVSWLTAW